MTRLVLGMVDEYLKNSLRLQSLLNKESEVTDLITPSKDVFGANIDEGKLILLQFLKFGHAV